MRKCINSFPVRLLMNIVSGLITKLKNRPTTDHCAVKLARNIKLYRLDNVFTVSPNPYCQAALELQDDA